MHLLFEKCPVLSNFSHKSILQTSAGNSNGTFPFCIRALQNICIDNAISYQPRKFKIWKLVNCDRIKLNYLGKWINLMKYPAWNKLIMLQSKVQGNVVKGRTFEKSVPPKLWSHDLTIIRMRMIWRIRSAENVDDALMILESSDLTEWVSSNFPKMPPSLTSCGFTALHNG